MNDYVIRIQLEDEDDYAAVHEKLAARKIYRTLWDGKAIVSLPHGTYTMSTDSSIDQVMWEVWFVCLMLSKPNAQIVISGNGQIRTSGLETLEQAIIKALKRG